MHRRGDPRDQQRMARVMPLFAELTRDGPVPAVKLVDGESMMLAWRDTLWIKRREVDQMSDRELRGTLAHELGHLHDPLRVRDRTITAAMLGLLAVLLLAALSATFTVWATALWAWILVMASVFMVLFWRSRRAEYRADALGARIASTEDLIASLEYMRRNGLDRWQDRLLPVIVSTHPRIAQRRRALRGRGNRAARSALTVLHGSHQYDGIEQC